MALAPWTKWLQERVRSGPVSYNRAVTEMAALIPPGRAYRASIGLAEWSRLKANVQNPKQYPNKEIEKDTRIRQGAARMARVAIWTQQKDGRVRIEGKGDERMVHLGPNPPGTLNALWVPKPKKPQAAIPHRMAPSTKHIWRRLVTGSVPFEALVQEASVFGTKASVVRDGIKDMAHRGRVSIKGTGDAAVVSRGPNFWPGDPPRA